MRWKVGAALAAALVFWATSADGMRDRIATTHVLVSERSAGPTVPGSFVGLSFTANYLPLLASAAHSGNLITLLRSIGPGVIRILDDTGFTLRAPAQLASSFWSDVGSVASQSGWKIILTVNLGHYDPVAAATEAAEAQRGLGNALLGVAIGNEPELYVKHGLRPPGWGTAAYQQELRSYRAAILAAAPSIAFIGPDSSSSSWDTAYRQVLTPTLITNHYYPLTSCHGQRPQPLALLASPTLTSEATDLAGYVSQAHLAGLPARLDETNSVSCGGKAPLSNTFESALWGAIYITQAMQAGESGINFHTGLDNCHDAGSAVYSLLCLPHEDSLQFDVRPLWYGLLLARDFVGSSPLSTTVRGYGLVSAAAFRDPSGHLQLLLVNRGARATAVTIRLAGRRLHRGRVLRLRAPSPLSTAGVTLGGRPVPRSGWWGGGLGMPGARRAGRQLVVRVPPYSAALITGA